MNEGWKTGKGPHGVPVLVYNSSWDLNHRAYQVGLYVDQEGWGWELDDREMEYVDAPTHWMNFPKEPST